MHEYAKTETGFAQQLPKNLIANILYFLINVAIGLYLVPYFISTLGVAAYGLIPLATSFTGYVGILVQSINTAVTRFLTIDLQRGDYPAANKTFSTAFFGLASVIALMIPIVIIVSYFIPVIFNVPEGQGTGAIILFICVSTAFFIRSLSGTFTVQLYAYNRLDLQNLVNAVNLLVQVGMIIIFFRVMGPNLAFVGFAYLIGAIAASIVAIFLAKRICPHLCLSISSFDRTKIGELGKLGGWVVVDQVGSLFIFQIDLIIVNLLFGATSAGQYAIVLQWSILLRSVASMLAGVIGPMIFIYYALKKTDALIEITQSAVKFMGLALALPVGLICGFAPQLLTFWVGPSFTQLAPLMVLLTFPLAVNLSVIPLFSINVAHNRVKIPGIVTIILGTVNLILAITIPLVTGWGYYGVALAGVLTMTVRHVLFVPWYAARVQNIRMITYLKSLKQGAIAVTLIGLLAGGIAFITSLNSLFMLIIAGLIITVIYGAVVMRFCLSSFEKELFESYRVQAREKIHNILVSNYKK